MLIMCAFFDDLHQFAHYKYTPECVIRIGESCSAAGAWPRWRFIDSLPCL